MRKQDILKLMIIILFVSRSYQWGWFNKVVETVKTAATNVANTVVNTAKTVVQAVSTFVNHTIPGFLFGNITWYAPEVPSSNHVATLQSTDTSVLSVTDGPSAPYFGFRSIPYLYITEVRTTRNLIQITVEVFFNYFGKQGRIEFKTLNFPDQLVNNIFSQMAYARNLYNGAKNVFLDAVATYTARAQEYRSIEKDHASNNQAILNRNANIQDTVNRINAANASMGNINLQINNQNVVVTNVSNVSNTSLNNYNQCLASRVPLIDVLSSLTNGSKNHNDQLKSLKDKKMGYLKNVESIVQDIGLILPHLAQAFQNASITAMNSLNVNDIYSLIGSKDVYINLE